MTKLFVISLTTFVLALAAPIVASATTTLEGCHSIPNLSVCLVDGSRTSGGCSPTDSDSVTGVFVQTSGGTSVYTEGRDTDRCGYHDSGIHFGAFFLQQVGGPYAFADWVSDSGGNCQMWVEAITHQLLLGCPAGPPPNPGWGDLLP